MSIRALLANLALFTLSLILAVTIWVTAVETDDPIVARNAIQIPVEVIGKPADVDVSNVPETVQISIEGPQTVLQNLPTDEIIAQINLNQVPFGESEVPIRIPFQQDGVRISDPFPSRATVTVEQIVTREIPVTVSIRGNVARGHAREEPLVEPDVIQVTGPASRVDQLAEVQVTIILENARETIKRSPPLIFRDQSGRVASVSGLTLSAEEVEVTVPIDELSGFAEKPITARWIGEPAPGYRLVGVNVEPGSVLVTGRSVQLDLLDRVRTEEINIEGLTESLTQQVSLDLPSGIALEEIQPIQIHVEIEPIYTVGAVLKQPELLDLGEGMEAILEPDEVRVFLFGPLPVLDTIQESDVRVSLDLFGLPAGSYILEPEVDVTSDQVEIRSWQPTRVTVTITRVVTSTEEITSTSALPGLLTLPLPTSSANTGTPEQPATVVAVLPGPIDITRSPGSSGGRRGNWV